MEGGLLFPLIQSIEDIPSFFLFGGGVSLAERTPWRCWPCSF